MQSTSVLDRPSSADAPQARDLLVLWRHPTTHAIIPIGRFTHESDLYAFAYTRGAAGIPDFRPLPGLDDLYQRYSSDRFPAVFDQRVMDSARPDYAAYLQSIGLDPESATPWEQIVESGGGRAGDTLQFMRVPIVSDGRAIARFFANGIRHIPDERPSINGRILHVTAGEQEAALRSLAAGDIVLIEAEDGNPKDEHAALITVGGVAVGWAPRALSASIRRLLGSGSIQAKVARVGGPATPPHLRLVIDLDVAAPSDFRFDIDGLWEPLVAQ